MGTIYRARDPILQRAVALKVISNLEVTPELRRRFFREAQACARLTHPNIVIVHDMGEDDGRLFIVMEYQEAADRYGKRQPGRGPRARPGRRPARSMCAARQVGSGQASSAPGRRPARSRPRARADARRGAG
jgi:serine/threonine-protein kinase